MTNDNKISEELKEEMREQLSLMLDEDREYNERLEAYEYLLEDCEELVPEMINHLYEYEGETGQMLLEVLAHYPGHKEVYLALVSYLYRGEDVALFARLIGSYGDTQGIELLNSFLQEYEVNYNEFMEIRNAIEELGGEVQGKYDFTDDKFYRYLKGLDEPEDNSRKSPFEEFFDLKSNKVDLNDEDTEEDDDDEEENCCEDECYHHHE